MKLIHGDAIVIATTNAGKVREFAHRFSSFGIEVLSLADFPDIPPIVEDGETFMANAEIKARAVAGALGRPALADDSGLCVDALGGEPGVYSARYAGEQATDRQNVEKLLRRLQTVHPVDSIAPSMPAWTEDVRFLSPARFVCALALVDPRTDKPVRAEGSCPGFIVDSPRGSNGFGYDPVFFMPEFGKTMAEMSLEEKQSVSHRGQALDRLINQFSR